MSRLSAVTGVRHLLAGVVACALAVGVTVAVHWGATSGDCPPGGARPSERRLIGYLAYWDQDRGLDALGAAGGAVTVVSPSWYTVLPGGEIGLQDERVDDSPQVVQQIREHAGTVMPVIANFRNGRWDRRVVERLLHDRPARHRHVDAVAELVVGRGYDGVDIDYEHLTGRSREAFPVLLEALADRLHGLGKRLSVTLHPKTTEPGHGAKNRAQDYAAIGRIADEVRLMLYDYHWDSSQPGSLAPIGWIRSVLEFAVTQIPPRKLILGLGTYGYDWVQNRGESVMWHEIRNLARETQTDVRWDEESASPWFRYVDARGRDHEVWFENAASIRAKSALAHELCLGGVHLWRLGGNDPALWRRR